MKYNIKIEDVEPDFWQKMDSLGIKTHTKLEGTIYQYVSYDTAIKIIEGNCLYYSPPNSFNDPFDLTSGLLDTSISEEALIKLISDGFITSEAEKQKLIAYNLSNPDLIPTIFAKTLDETKSKIGITCFSKSYLKTLMWSHYANKHTGICFGFSFNQVAGDGVIQLSVRYTDKVEPRNYFKETIFAIYNWIFTKSKVWEYKEEVRRVYVREKGLIPFNKQELIEVYYGVKVSENQIKNIQQLLQVNCYNNIVKQSSMKINPQTFDLIECNL